MSRTRQKNALHKINYSLCLNFSLFLLKLLRKQVFYEYLRVCYVLFVLFVFTFCVCVTFDDNFHHRSVSRRPPANIAFDRLAICTIVCLTSFTSCKQAFGNHRFTEFLTNVTGRKWYLYFSNIHNLVPTIRKVKKLTLFQRFLLKFAE